MALQALLLRKRNRVLCIHFYIMYIRLFGGCSTQFELILRVDSRYEYAKIITQGSPIANGFTKTWSLRDGL